MPEWAFANDTVVTWGLPKTAVTTLTANSGTRLYFPYSAVIQGITVSAGTAPTGASLIVDVNKNGTTIFTTQGNRPTLTAGSNVSSEVTNMDINTITAGDYLTVDVDQIGAPTPGAAVSVAVRLRRA